jgi:hypothetical protein
MTWKTFFRLVVVTTAAFNIRHAQALGFFNGVREKSKSNLLGLISSGAPSSQIMAAVEKTEALSPFMLPFQSPVTSSLLNDTWLMVYTTSFSIAGRSRPAFLQTLLPPEQIIDTTNLRAVNSEIVLGVRNAVEASIRPSGRTKVDVQFEKFVIGPLKFASPRSLSGFLDTTFLDETMRISRGDRGNIFVLLREVHSLTFK